LLHACSWSDANTIEAGGEWNATRPRYGLDFARGYYLADGTNLENTLGSIHWAYMSYYPYDPVYQSSIMFYTPDGWENVTRMPRGASFVDQTPLWQLAVRHAVNLTTSIPELDWVEGNMASAKGGHRHYDVSDEFKEAGGVIRRGIQYVCTSDASCRTLHPSLILRVNIEWTR
jgi:hypothetical protein